MTKTVGEMLTELDRHGARVSLLRDTYSAHEGKNWSCTVCLRAEDGEVSRSTVYKASAEEALTDAYEGVMRIVKRGVPLAQLAPPVSVVGDDTNTDIPF